LPSKIFIDDNKNINNEEEKFKDAIEELKKNHTLITVTTDYMYNYLFEDRKDVDRSNLKPIKRTEFIKKIESMIKKAGISFENLKNYLKKNDTSNIPEEDKHIVKVLCNENEANIIVNNLKMPPISDKKIEEMRGKILRHAMINYGPYKKCYFPQLLAEGVDKIEDINNEKIDDIEEFEKNLAVESIIFIALGISTSNSLEELTYEAIEKGIKVLKNIVPFLSFALPGVAAFGAGLAGAFLSIFSTNLKKESNFGAKIVGGNHYGKLCHRKERSILLINTTYYITLHPVNPLISLTIFLVPRT